VVSKSPDAFASGATAPMWHAETECARWIECAALIALSVAFLVTGLGFSFLDMGEGIYGTITSEMLRGGDWLVPHLDGLPYLEKPPLYFWLSAATLSTGLSVEWATRLWSALPAVGSVLLVWRLGALLYGGNAGVLAGIALASCPGFVLLARRASPDLLMVFCLTLAIYGFVRDLDRPRSSSRFLLLYLAMALGLLAKGILGIGLPILIIGAWLAWTRRIALRDLNVARGALLFGAVALPWHIVVGWRNPAHFWFYLIDNQVLRFLNNRTVVEDDISISTLGFLVVGFLLCFPWSVFILARRQRAQVPSGDALVVLWAVAVIGLFALSGSKLEYYVMPALPALALCAGAAWAARRKLGLWIVLGASGSALVGIWALFIGHTLTADQALRGLAELNVYYRILQNQGLPLPFASPRPFGVLLQGLGVILLAGWGVAAACWFRARPRAAFGALVGTAAGVAVLIVSLLTVIEPHHSARAVGTAIRELARVDDIVVHEGMLEYSGALPLYAGRQVLLVNGMRGDLEFASRLPEAAGMFLDSAQFLRLWRGDRHVFLVTQRVQARSVVAALPPESTYDLGLYGSRRLISNRATDRPLQERGQAPR
jgi:4-amino-4-deoxy-L-arabinose transferase-like glycosyltransferase